MPIHMNVGSLHYDENKEIRAITILYILCNFELFCPLSTRGISTLKPICIICIMNDRGVVTTPQYSRFIHPATQLEKTNKFRIRIFFSNMGTDEKSEFLNGKTRSITAVWFEKSFNCQLSFLLVGILANLH